jgi:WD40 repeat protein
MYFSPDGKKLASTSIESSVRLWDVATGKQLLATEDVPGGLWCVAVLPDGRHCVSAGGDGVVRLWRWAR